MNQRIPVIYWVTIGVAAFVAILSLILAVFRRDLYQLTYFDPVIGWVGLVLALAALGPTLVAPNLNDTRAARVVLAMIVVLGLFQILLIFRGLGAENMPGDFRIYWTAGQRVYSGYQSPYNETTLTAPAFPFPTYLIYWLSSLGGYLAVRESFAVYTLANGIIWFVCCFVLWREYHIPAGYSVLNSWLIFWLVNSTAYESFVALGQTTILAFAPIVGALIFFGRNGVGSWFIAGAVVGIAAMVKPQMIVYLIAVGLLLFVRSQPRRTMLVRLSALIGAGCAVILGTAVSLVLPSGINLDTYRQFLFEVYPKITNPQFIAYNSVFGLIKGNASPVALVVTVLGALGLPPASTTYSVVSFLGILLFAFVMLRWANAGHSLSHYFLLWSFAPLLVTPLTHTYAVVWVTPILLLLVRNMLIQKRRSEVLILLTLLIGLLRVQDTIFTLFALVAAWLFALKWFNLNPTENADAIRVRAFAIPVNEIPKEVQ